MYHVCALLYGNHPDLASRCLSSIARLAASPHVGDVRIGLNMVVPATRLVVDDFVRHVSPRVPVHLWRHPANGNNLKYPTMREMFYGSVPLTRDRIMWFDDDSCFSGPNAGEWLEDIDAKMRAAGAVLAGSPYRQRKPWPEQTVSVITKSPWHGGVPMDTVVSFATGGWWVADRGFLTAWNYPFPGVWHNGGDRLLGELVRQQKATFLPFREHVAINADMAGRESRAPRRGFSQEGELPYLPVPMQTAYILETHGGPES